MSKFVEKPQEVEAFQFVGTEAKVQVGPNTIPVIKDRTGPCFQLDSGFVRPTDWVVVPAFGVPFHMDDAEFKATYAPVVVTGAQGAQS